MRILDIDIYRDGGSISFRVERDESASLVWLDTPFDGEPRALRIIAVPIRRGNLDREEAAAAVLAEMKSVRSSDPIKRGDPAVGRLLADIGEWWKMVPSEVQQRVSEEMSREGPHYVKLGEVAEALQTSELSHVISVRDYVLRHYAG